MSVFVEVGMNYILWVWIISRQMVTQFPTGNKVLLTARTFVSISTMKRFVIVETLRGVYETIFVFHEGKIDVTSGGSKYLSRKA